MNLAIDIGNSLTKMAVVEGGQVIDTFCSECVDAECLEPVFKAYPDIRQAIIVCTRGGCQPMERYILERVERYIRFDHTVPVPLKNLYKTPETLGHDRLAAAVGANALYPDSNVLIFDFGTAITIDMVTAKGEYLGGNISPGARTRFRALHQYTSTLPMRDLTERTQLLGRDTNEAVEGGVTEGIVYEIEGYIKRISDEYRDVRIIFTGGDGNFFAKRLKNPIFATYDLVVYGLNRILEYNAN